MSLLASFKRIITRGDSENINSTGDIAFDKDIQKTLSAVSDSVGCFGKNKSENDESKFISLADEESAVQQFGVKSSTGETFADLLAKPDDTSVKDALEAEAHGRKVLADRREADAEAQGQREFHVHREKINSKVVEASQKIHAQKSDDAQRKNADGHARFDAAINTHKAASIQETPIVQQPQTPAHSKSMNIRINGH